MLQCGCDTAIPQINEHVCRR